MSTEILTPPPEMTEKDRCRLAFQRSDRIQDHGVAANTLERDDEYEREMAQRRKDKLAQRVLHEGLADMSPAKLEKEADRLLADVDLETATVDEFDDTLRYDATHVEEDESFKEKRLPPSERNFTVVDVRDEGDYTDEFGLAQEMALRRQMRGRRGSTSSPDFTYEGTHGDDEDLADTATPMGGYQIR